MTASTHTRPTLVLSQDYELFFQRSGSIEKCLFEPTGLLMDYAAKNDLKLTFFIDTGMLKRFDDYSGKDRALARAADAVRHNLQAIDEAGHELALHIHPHWEDTVWRGDHWDFENTRYQLRSFSDAEIEQIFRSNFELLQAMSSQPVRAYRAGGFCIEPFQRIAPIMRELGLVNESSVVPGMRLKDPDKGFDFSAVADTAGWLFSESPLKPQADGEFTELAITPLTVSRLFYWQRLIARLRGEKGSAQLGDGVSKAIGRKEIIRRLGGFSRTSELSVDAAKAGFLNTTVSRWPDRVLWHLMGHPKLLSPDSLRHLSEFRQARGLTGSKTVSSACEAIRASAAWKGDPVERQD